MERRESEEARKEVAYQSGEAIRGDAEVEKRGVSLDVDLVAAADGVEASEGDVPLVPQSQSHDI